MGLGDSVFTIIFIMMGASAVISGLNFEKKQGKNFKGENYQEYIEDLLGFIFSWILEHIVEKDKQIMHL